jgi:LysR family glycine cleavage system transcriptional activator
VRAQLVVPVRSYPVCSDEFLARHSPLGSPRDLLRLPLLGFTPQPDLWSKWLGAAGIGQVPKPSYMFDDLNVLCQAAANGLGMAIGLDVVIEPYLQNSQLVRPFADPVTLPKGYYMIARTPDWTRRPVSTFREWLLAEAGAWREIAGGGLLPAPAATAHRA